MLQYATTQELINYNGGKSVDSSDTLIRSATALVRRETKYAVYRTGADGLAESAVIRAALRDATCAQVLFWAALGYNPALGTHGSEPIIASEGVTGASVSYYIDKDAAKAATKLGDTLAPLARDELEAMGMLSRRVRSY